MHCEIHLYILVGTSYLKVLAKTLPYLNCSAGLVYRLSSLTLHVGFSLCSHTAPPHTPYLCHQQRGPLVAIVTI
jgi:hypothetical protein